MKYQIQYSPDSMEKLLEIKTYITNAQSKALAETVISKLLREINDLQYNPEKGASVEALIDLSTPYRFLHIGQNYVFYRIESNNIYVTDLFDEREDFLWKMFRIRSRTQESIEFWGE